MYYAPVNDKTMTYIQVSITQSVFMGNKRNTPESIYNTTKTNLIDPKKAMQADGIGSEYYLVIMAGNSDKAEVKTLMGEAAKLACKNLNALLK